MSTSDVQDCEHTHESQCLVQHTFLKSIGLPTLSILIRLAIGGSVFRAGAVLALIEEAHPITA